VNGARGMAKLNIAIDASQLDMFILCAERYNIRYRQNRVTPVKAHQLDRGSVVHVGCEIYYRALKDGSNYQDAVTAALSKVREAAVVSSDLEPEETNRVVEVMEEYFDYWRVADQNFRIDAVEQPFIYLLYEDDEMTINLAGKIDMIVSDDKYSKVPYDHKSYDRRGEVLRMTNQFQNYAVVTNSNYLFVNRIGFQSSVPPHDKFMRVPLSYDPYYLEQWRQNTIKIIKHQYLEFLVENVWPMNYTSCDKYNRRCEYYEVCDSSGMEAKLYKLERNYVVTDAWDVSKALRSASQILEDTKKDREKANGTVETRS
jgi:PD-(D/E)XK nuclease superfamily